MYPNQRHTEWKSSYPNLRNWTLLAQFNRKSEAQTYESNTAYNHGCDASPGGGGEEYATWFVYHFDY